MKTKNLFLYMVAAATTLFATTSCMDGDWDAPDLTNPPYGNNTITVKTATTIAQLKKTYSGEIANKGCKLVTDDVQLKAVVTGNDIGGNLYKQISIQDETGDMIVGINASGLYPYMAVGQSIIINLKDLYIGGYGQQAQIGSLYNGSIGRMEQDVWKQHVRLVGAPKPELVVPIEFDPTWNMADYCGKYVKLTDVTIEGADGKAVLAPDDGSVALTSNCANRNIKGLSKTNVVLRTSTYADFANMVIPSGKVDIYGIATRYNNTWQILMRSESDIVIK